MKKIRTTLQKTIIPFLNDWVNAIVDDNCFNMSAALAYYTTFSLAPTLILLVVGAGFFLDQADVRQHIYQYAQTFTGAEVASIIQTLLEKAQFSSHGLTATIISIGTIIAGATTVFAALHSSLNHIWEVRANKQQGFWAVVIQRLLGLAAILLIGALLLVALIVQFIVSVLYKFIDYIQMHFSWFAPPEYLRHFTNNLIPLGIMLLFFALIFKLLSDARIRWKHVWLGAAVTTALLWLGRWGISLYLSFSSVGSVYGTAATLATFLIWIYYSALILFVGAEFIKIYARYTGSNVDSDEVLLRQEGRKHIGRADVPYF